MTQKNYTVTTPDELRRLCCRNGWFTEGSNAQYDALFETNEGGVPEDDMETLYAMAGMIWICSNREKHSLHDISERLFDEGLKYCLGDIYISDDDGGKDDG